MVSKREYIKIALFDGLGSEVKVIYNGMISAGNHTLDVDIQNLPAGNYFVRIASDSAQNTKLLVKY